VFPLFGAHLINQPSTTNPTPQQDTLQYARLLGDDDKSFIPAHLEPPPEELSKLLLGSEPSKHKGR
jgi:hypothetical protein